MTTNTTTTTTTSTSTTSTAPMDLAVIEKNALDRLNKTAQRNDLDDLLAGARRSLLLIDCSGSMSDHIRAGGRKIDALRTTVQTLRASHSVPVAAFGAYGAAVQVVETVPEPSGMTPLDLAIDFGRDQGANHLLVVTDGQPDSEERAIAAARRFGHPVDVFYIGDGNDSGARFARELARITGGTCSLTDLGQPKALAATMHLMLGDGGL